MFAKLHKIYGYFFKFLICFNIVVSVLCINFLLEVESPSMRTYLLLVIIKGIGYGLSVVIEKWFYAKSREYFFKNLGLGYRHIFGYLFLVDALLFIIIFFGWKMIMNFL